MRQFAFVSTAVLLLLAACTGAADDGETPPDSPGSSLPDLSMSAKPSPPPSLGGTVTGVFGLAEIETGCPYLEADDGTRYEILYPDGWELRRSPLELVAPSGEIQARAGDTVTVRGGLATDMASTCQIGPIFRATEVVTSD